MINKENFVTDNSILHNLDFDLKIQINNDLALNISSLKRNELIELHNVLIHELFYSE